MNSLSLRGELPIFIDEERKVALPFDELANILQFLPSQGEPTNLADRYAVAAIKNNDVDI